MHHSIRDEDWIRQEVISFQEQSYNRIAASVSSEFSSVGANAMSNKMVMFAFLQRLCNKSQIQDLN